MGKIVILVALFLCVLYRLPVQQAQAGAIVVPEACRSANDCDQYVNGDLCGQVGFGVSYFACINKDPIFGIGDCEIGCGVCNWCSSFPPNDCGVAYTLNCGPTPTGFSSCNTSAPSNLSVNWQYPGANARFTWTPGANGSSQGFGIAEDMFSVSAFANCNPAKGANCIVFEQGLPTSQASYLAAKNLFTLGKTYYWGVVNVAGTCSKRTITDTIYAASTPTNTPVPPTNTPVPPTNTPIPVGSIWARAVQVDPNNTSCADVFSVPTTDGQINGATLQFTPSSASQPTPLTQSGANFAVFSDVVTGSYTLDPNPPSADWAFSRACWRNLAASPQQGEGMTATLGGGQALRFDMGYTLGTAWVQTQGGDVYAAGSIRSYLPAVTPRVFNADGGGGFPGVVTYGTEYDFDSDPFATGGNLVSSTNWLVNDSRPTVDYYDFFYRRFGSPITPTTDPAFATPLAVTKPPSSTNPYYVSGDMTTSGNWTIGEGESIVILVDGNLTLGGRVNITGNGFIAFIVNGTITVADTVGTTAASTTPVVEGVYITSPTGTFATGDSISGGAARFVGRGMFVAGNFLLQRDLDGMGGGGNIENAAELFIYNPRLLVTMPDAMRGLSVTWQEVAP